MNSKILLITTVITFSGLLISSCGGEGIKKDEKPVDVTELTKNKPEIHGPIVTENQIELTNPLNKAWADSGQKVYELKCASCHKLTEEKLVGPGWKDVTKKRSAVWIMNMITNTDYMLDADAEARKLLELCMVRMPNQNLSFDDARHVYEFQRKNDGEK